VSRVSPKQVFRIKKRDFLTLVGEKVTKSPKRTKAKPIEKTSEELKKKRRESYWQDKRYRIFELRATGMPMKEIADKIGVAVGTVWKWCDRLYDHIKIRTEADLAGKKPVYPKGEGVKAAIISRSRAPKNPRRKITAEHVNAVKEVRGKKFRKKMGAQKIKVYLDMDISHQSINKILKDTGLTAKRKKRKQKKFDPFRRGCPNELWQIDYKEFGKGVYMLSVKDDYSSAILSADVRSTYTTEDVKEILGRTIRLFGTPKQILSDHGTQWCATNGGVSKFDKWCYENGIEHIMGRIRKPTTQGKVERWHGTVLEEAELPPKGSSVEEYREAVLEYMEFYNNERPHHGIGLQIPTFTYMGGLILDEIITNIGVHEVT